MGYIEMFQSLRQNQVLNSSSDGEINARLSIRYFSVSALPVNRPLASHSHEEQNKRFADSVNENLNFTYPVLFPSGKSKFSEAIILLHGLNERNWIKYHTWATEICNNTGKPVILFPISHHMNRAPEDWGNIRSMAGYLKSSENKQATSSFANVALSERLTEDPLRFFYSGLQTSSDVLALVQQIKTGSHPMFEKGSHTDFFAYSIGGFLAQILFLAYGDDELAGSRLFLFCSGSFFSEMNGVSKLIMNQPAYNQLHRYYVSGIEAEIKAGSPLSSFLTHERLGIAFRSMLSVGRLQSFRDNMYRKIADRIKAVSLLGDKVIPAKGTVAVLNRFTQVEVLDFAFDYAHEMPFPVNQPGFSAIIDNAFETIFARVSGFLR